MTTTVTAKIVPRQGTAAAWTSANPTLMFGERGMETDTGYVKLGDGVTEWNDLDYAATEGTVAAHIASTANPHSVTAAQVGALTSAAADLVYAAIANGVTGGASHDHSGGDGAQIAYSGLSGLPTLGTAAATDTTAYVAAGADAADLTSGAATDGQVLTADGAGGAAWEDAAAGGITDGATLSTGLTFPVGGLHILDTDGTHDLIVSPGSNLTADRTLTITTGDANRTLTLTADASVEGTNTGNQDLSSYTTGPASSTDNALARFHETGGKTLQNSVATLSDNGSLTLTGATVTTSQPIIDVTQTWNDAAVTFTGIKANVTDTASALGSNLLDLQVGSASKFSVNKAGTIKTTAQIINFVSDTTSAMYIWAGTGGAGNLLYLGGSGTLSTVGMATSYSGTSLRSVVPFGWVSGSNINTAADLTLYRDAAHTLAQRLTTNAQTFRLYNTWTDASNYERLAFTWDSNTAKIQTEALGTGTLRDLSIGSTGGKLAFLGATPVVRQAHVADADTAHALNATFSDTEVESALNALATKLNSILATLEAFGLHATS